MVSQTRAKTRTRREFLKASASAGLSGLAAARSSIAGLAGDRNTLLFGARVLPAGELTIAATAADIAKIQPLVDEYARAHRVVVRVEGNEYTDHYAKLNINLTQSTGAYDVVSIDDPWMPLFAGGEYLKNLTEMMENASVRLSGDFMPTLRALGEYPVGTSLRGIPWIGNVQMFAWRTDVLEEMRKDVPTTWDDVLGLAAEITERYGASGLSGIGIRGKPGNDAATSFLPVLRGFGTELLDPETSEPLLESTTALAALDLHVKLATLAPKGVETVDHARQRDNLLSGRIALSADTWPDQFLLAGDPDRSKVAGSIQVGPEPAQPGVQRSTMTGAWLLAIPEGSQHHEQALRFILWITEAEQQRRLMMDQYLPGTRYSVLNDAEIMAKLPILPALRDAIRTAVPRPRTPLYASLEQIFGRYVAEAILGSISSEEAMITANQEMRELLVREGFID